MIHETFLLELFTRALQRDYKDQPKAILLAIAAAAPTSPMKRVAMLGPLALTSHLGASSKTGGYTKWKHKPVQQT
jgi:hypothetical protein